MTLRRSPDLEENGMGSDGEWGFKETKTETES